MHFSLRKGKLLGTLFTILSILVACESNDDSNSDSSSSSSGDTVSSSGGYQLKLNLDNVQVHFPPQGVSTASESIIVRGVVADSTDLEQLYINDIAVDSIDGLASWQLELPLEPGENILTLSSEDSDGLRTPIRSLNVSRGVNFSSPSKMAFDATNNRALVWDNLNNTILSVDLESGSQTRFSSLVGETGGLINNPRGMTLDTANNRIIVYQQAPEGSDTGPLLVALDLNSREQSEISLQDLEDVIELNEARDLVIEGSNAYWADMEGVYVSRDTGERITSAETNSAAIAMGAIYTVDLSSGVKTTLSSYGSPDNFVLGTIIDMCTTSDLDKLYLVDSILDQGEPLYRLISTDKDSGKSDVITVSDSDDKELDMLSPQAIECSPENVFILDANQVVAINQSSLTFNILSKTGTPEGSQYPIRKATDLAFNGTNLLLVDDSLDYLLLVNSESGQRSQLSGATDDNPEGFGSIVSTGDICINAETDKAFIFDNLTSLMRSVDLNTAEQQIVARTTGDEEEGTPRLVYPLSCAINYSEGTMFVLDNFNQRPSTLTSSAAPKLISIDQNTGDISSLLNFGRTSFYDSAFDEINDTLYTIENNYIRKLVRTNDEYKSSLLSYNQGRNPSHPFANIRALDIDYDSNRLLVIDKDRKSIVAVNLDNGVRSPFSNSAFPVDGGPLFSQPQSIVIDRKNQRALVNDSVKGAIFAIDLSTGSRQIVFQNPENAEGPLFNTRKLAIHPVYGYLLISDTTTNTIQALDIATQQSVTLTR